MKGYDSLHDNPPTAPPPYSAYQAQPHPFQQNTSSLYPQPHQYQPRPQITTVHLPTTHVGVTHSRECCCCCCSCPFWVCCFIIGLLILGASLGIIFGTS